MEINTLIEIISVAFSFTYLLLVMRENIWCWLFGILSSLLSIYLFIEAQLYSEAVLYTFYVWAGFYGWYLWHKPKATDSTPLKISTWNWDKHLMAIGVGLLTAFGLGTFFKENTDAQQPYIDAATTMFSFIATFMEAHKILSAWLFWIIINGVSIWLYSQRGLNIYGGLMVVYFVFSFIGWWQWKKSYENQ